MRPTQKAILDKTHYGLNIYAYVLRNYYPGDTVLSLSGRDCKPTKNPFSGDSETLVVKIDDGCARHSDTENWEFQGDVFDFAELAFKLSGQELLDKINEVMNLRLDEEKNFYRNSLLPEKAQKLIDKNSDAPVVSYFLNPVRNITPSREVSLLQVYNKIRSDAFKTQTERLRSIEDEKEARKYKAANFHYVTFSGTFIKRCDAELKKHSGLLTIDLDHLEETQELKKKLLKDEYFETQMLFVSPSGEGLKWIIPIDLNQATHQEYFQAVSNYMEKVYQVKVDQMGKDVSRACFLSYDSEVYINPKYL